MPAAASSPAPRRPLPVGARVLLAAALAAALVGSTVLVVGQLLPGGETAKIVLAFLWLGGLGFGIGKLVKGRTDLRVATRTAVVVAAGGIGAWWALSLRDTTVDEALVPAAAPAAPAANAPAPDARPAAPAGPRLLAAGSFRSLEHASSGRAELVSLPGGGTVLQFRRLMTDSGPDLRVYLATDASASKFVDLGGLKGNRGNQRYRVPAGAARRYDTALIWCRSFSVGFAAADLKAAAA
ncbi:MAG: DM13 domain-containing protein [Solirubrobacteraceae bacterium]